VVAGSTGEAHMLDELDYERLLAFAVERIAHRVPVIAGTGEAATVKTIALTRRARALGCRRGAGGDAVLRASDPGRLASPLRGSRSTR